MDGKRLHILSKMNPYFRSLHWSQRCFWQLFFPYQHVLVCSQEVWYILPGLCWSSPGIKRVDTGLGKVMLRGVASEEMHQSPWWTLSYGTRLMRYRNHSGIMASVLYILNDKSRRGTDVVVYRSTTSPNTRTLAAMYVQTTPEIHLSQCRCLG